MIRRNALIFVVGWMCLAVLTAQPGFQKRSILAYVEAGTILTGETARVTGYADAGKKIVVTAAGLNPPAAAETTAAVNRAFSVEIGPFEQSGTYTLTVTAEREGGAEKERTVVYVQVVDPPPDAEEAFESAYGQALAAAVDASDRTLSEVQAGLEAIPGDDPNIKKAEEDVADVREKIPELRRGIRQFVQAETLFEQTLQSEPNLDREAMGDYRQFLTSSAQSIREQSERLIALGREASGGQTDACVGVALAAQALSAQKTLMELMNSGLKDYLTDWAKSADIDAAKALPSWLPVIKAKFLKGLKSIFEGTPEEQVLNRTAAPASESLVSRWDLLKLLFNTAKGFAEGGPWGAAKAAIDDAVDIAIDTYSKSYCLSFKGKISGHTHVEALDNGRPMYGLDNDWEGDAQIMCAKPSGKDPVAFRGMLTGKAKNFKIANFLRTLYEGKPGNFQYLTGDPSTAQKFGAVFIVPLEGTVAGGKIAIKGKKGGVDFDGRVVAKLAVVIIPTGSPVPLVQKFGTPFQPGWWHLTRALGEGGMTTLEITMDGEKRVVKKEWSRDLTAAGARGRFSIKVDLCAGCEDD